MCSAGQQVAVMSWLSPAVPAATRHAIWYAWFTSYKRVVFLSAPAHLTTIFFSLLNCCYSDNHGGGPWAWRWWWLACAAFVLAHGYPVALGLQHFAMTAEDWRRRSNAEGTRWLQQFADVNRTRLLVVDVPGWLCVVATVVGSLG